VRKGEEKREREQNRWVGVEMDVRRGEKRIEVSGPQCRERRVVVVLSEL